jgi:hypothetical protein
MNACMPIALCLLFALGNAVHAEEVIRLYPGPASGTKDWTHSEKLTGQYRGYFGEAPLTGTVKDNEIKVSFRVDAAGQDVTITFFGTVQRSSMKGEINYGEDGEYGTGTFVGKRE